MNKSIPEWARDNAYAYWRANRAFKHIRPNAPKIGRYRLVDIGEDHFDLLAELRRRDEQYAATVGKYKQEATA